MAGDGTRKFGPPELYVGTSHGCKKKKFQYHLINSPSSSKLLSYCLLLVELNFVSPVEYNNYRSLHKRIRDFLFSKLYYLKNDSTLLIPQFNMLQLVPIFIELYLTSDFYSPN